MLERHQRRDRQASVAADPLERKEAGKPRTGMRAAVRSIDEDELELPARAEIPKRRFEQNRLVEDVALERLGGQILEITPMLSQIVEIADDDNFRRAGDRERGGPSGSGKYLSDASHVPATELPDRSGLNSRTLLRSHRSEPSRRVVPWLDST